MKSRTLFVKRTLKNAADLRSWGKSQGFEDMLADGDMHVTIAFSKQAFDWSKLQPLGRTLINRGGRRVIKRFGEAVVLCFPSDRLEGRWREFCDEGASYDFDAYHPHVTLTYQKTHPRLTEIALYTGDLVFGGETFAEVNDNWKDTISED